MSIQVLIADDEPLARQGIALRLRAHPDLVIVGEACDGQEALERIEQLQPTLVFLDIRMPGLSGLELINRLDRRNMPIIFLTTAYDEYAVAAFEREALDYLLKPIDSERFQSERRSRQAASAQSTARRFASNNRGGVFVSAADGTTPDALHGSEWQANLIR